MRKLERELTPAVSVINMQKKEWLTRRAEWESLGYDDTATREGAALMDFGPNHYKKRDDDSYVSRFDPCLAEQVYRWLCKDGGDILDPFCGGPTRGVVASSLGYRYTGIDIREEQVSHNISECGKLECQNVRYICGDSKKVLDDLDSVFDLVFTCPPYANLEQYSTMEDDISTMKYDDFMVSYKVILRKACKHLRIGGFAAIVVSDVRGKDGYYHGLVADTVKLMQDIGMDFFFETVLVQRYGSATLRAPRYMKRHKVARVHQNLLVFGKRVHEVEPLRRKIEKFSKTSGKSVDELWEEMNRMQIARKW